MSEEENKVNENKVNENNEDSAAAEEENGSEANENTEIDAEEEEEGEETRTKPKKSVLKIVTKALTVAGFTLLGLLVLLIGWMCIQKYVMKSSAPSLFGYSFFIVSTGSMSGMIEEGDVVIVKKTGDYAQGDVITFLHEGETTPTTHMIFEILKDENGAVTGYITRGVANNTDDLVPVTEDEILGEVMNTIPHLGLFFIWFKSEGGWIYLAGVVLIIAVGVYLYQKFIKERNDEEPSEPPEENDGTDGTKE